MATHRVPGVRNSAMLVVSLDTDRGWWRAARPEAHASGSDHAWGGGPRGSLCPRCSGAQRSPGEPQRQGLGAREPDNDGVLAAARKFRGFAQRPDSMKSCAASRICRRREPVWGGAPRGSLLRSSSAGQRWRAGAEWESVMRYRSMIHSRIPEPPRTSADLRRLVFRASFTESCCASGICRRVQPVWGGAPRGSLFLSSSAGQLWRARV